MKRNKAKACEEESEYGSEIYQPDSVYYNVDSRIFYLHGDIIEKVSIIFISAITEMNKKSQKLPIKVDINSSGGNLDTVTSIISTIKNSEAPVDTFISGSAFSAGAFAFLAGRNRKISPVSTMMLHYPIYRIEDSSDRILESSKTTTAVYMRLMEYLLKDTKLTTAYLSKKIKKTDWFLSPDEALRLGLANEITG